MKKITLILVFACAQVALLGTVGAAGFVPKVDQDQRPPSERIVCGSLLRAYHAEIAADKKYTGQRLLVDGCAVSSQVKDGKQLVVLAEENAVGIYNDRIHCIFDQDVDLSSVQAGNGYLIVGTCRGLDKDYSGHVVKLTHCRLQR